MKKFAFLLCAFFAGTAQATAHTPHSFTGVYARGAIGATTTRFDVDPHYRADTFIDFSFLGDYRMYDTSPSGLLGLGYLFQFNDFFVLGAEATAGYTKTEASYRASFDEVIHNSPDLHIELSNQVQSKLTNDFALLIKPGFFSKQGTLFYGLIGPRWGNFKTTTSPYLLIGSSPFFAVAESTVSESGYELGLTAGVGIMQKICESLFLSLEYAYTDYGDINAPNVSAPITVNGIPTGDITHDAPEIQASTNTLLLGLSYQW